MPEKFNKCNPVRLVPNDLMSADWVIMTQEVIKNQCECVNKWTCLILVQLLKSGKYDEANRLQATLERKK